MQIKDNENSNENSNLNEDNLLKNTFFKINYLEIYKSKYKLNLLKIFFLLLNITLIISLIILNIKEIMKKEKNSIILKENLKKSIKNLDYTNEKIFYQEYYNYFKKESSSPQLKEISKKMTFIQRLPLPEKIKCKPHIKNKELIAFLSFLTDNTIFFETGSGCSSVIAKYFAKKTYAVEGCKKFYEYGIKNGLEDSLIFKDLKPDNPIWSYPGKKSNLNDWKYYFQAYKKEYNADVILIDGRFKVATAMDIFNKIRNDTIILLHEFNQRPEYFILENYYKYIYHWETLFVFIKRNEIKEIPLEIQKQYWEKPL